LSDAKCPNSRDAERPFKGFLARNKRFTFLSA
jgi:hypothetical protein